MSVRSGWSAQNPVLYADAGVVYLIHTEQRANKGQGTSRVVQVTSEDGGKSWSAPRVLNLKTKGEFVKCQVLRNDAGEVSAPRGGGAGEGRGGN